MSRRVALRRACEAMPTNLTPFYQMLGLLRPFRGEELMRGVPRVSLADSLHPWLHSVAPPGPGVAVTYGPCLGWRGCASGG